MTLRLSSPLDALKAQTRLNALIAKGATIELTEKSFRTPNQNRYAYLLMGMVAMFTGNSLEDTKEWYFKRVVNPDLFIVKRNDKLGNLIETTKSTRELTKEQMTIAIDRFKRWGYENQIPMPEQGDERLLAEIEIEMGRQAKWI